jgi:hypothetical protein
VAGASSTEPQAGHSARVTWLAAPGGGGGMPKQQWSKLSWRQVACLDRHAQGWGEGEGRICERAAQPGVSACVSSHGRCEPAMLGRINSLGGVENRDRRVCPDCELVMPRGSRSTSPILISQWALQEWIATLKVRSTFVQLQPPYPTHGTPAAALAALVLSCERGPCRRAHGGGGVLSVGCTD